MAKTRPGTFIIIEGTDGSGKGTQFGLLKERLEREGYDVATFDFPQYDQPSSYFVTRYLNGAYGGADDVGPYTSSLFYALDRFEAAPKIKEALDAGKVVISNRFTGSSMGHQGTKFDNPEERRGFFIWLDNLEFEMLHIPRPDMSFVLRVPADIAQGLVDKKAARSYTDKKRDIHEADLSHLERAVNVYDDLCQLFPKDFTRIDCVRGNQLLDVPTVQELLWQKVNPLLPEPPKLRQIGAATSDDPAITAAIPETSPADKSASALLADKPVTLEHVSHLLFANLIAHRAVKRMQLVDYTQKDESGQYHYLTPAGLPPEIKAQYCLQLDSIFKAYSQMHAALTTYLQETTTDKKKPAMQAQVQATLRAILPVAATTSVQIEQAADPDTTAELLGSELAELRHAGQFVATKAGLPNPATLVTYRAGRRTAVQQLLHNLQETYASTDETAQLVQVWPRNELDLVTDILYEHSSSAFRTIQETAAMWPYDQKLKLLEAYLGERQDAQQVPDRSLSHARYNWELLSDFDSFCAIVQGGLVHDVQWQPLTPRHGFAVPKLIEEAGLTESFEACFDRSLALYSLLQQAGFSLEAQYATLMGHKLRWRVSYDAASAFRLHEHYATPTAHAGAQALVRAMHHQLLEVHPVIGEAMRFTQDPTS